VRDLTLEYESVELDKIARSFFALEVGRSAVKSNESIPSWVIEHFSFSEATLRELLLIYIERSSSRVMSIGSILARDLIQLISCSQARIELPLEREDQITLLSVIEELREGVEPKYVVESKLDYWKANER
ncbi:hypothetical protein, partial [Vibrio breoganii]|uniref:hypothetical protein n=1 Tax=Vibrio breoganii TaxID=553239 RepID=UPI0018E49AD6